ncbi:MAG: amidohydrolase [Chloroflexota bacterium]
MSGLVVRGGRVFAGGHPGSAALGGRATGPMADGAPTAVAISGDRIMAIGTDRDADGWSGPDTEVIEADGGLILPGFNDAHTHLRWAPTTLSRLDLFGITDLSDVQVAIRAFAAAHPERAWVAGRGWLYAAFPGGMPTREQLDAAVPDRPAYFECFDGHSGWANSLALTAAGIDERTPDPVNGQIVRDTGGQATGALLERATEAIEALIPPPSADESLALLRAGLTAMAHAGITAVQDAWAREEGFATLDRLRDADGRLPIRVRSALEMLPGQGEAGLRAILDRYESTVAPYRNDPWLRGGILKSFIDGVVEAHTASLLTPYPGSTTRGDPRWAEEELRSAVAEAHGRGWQVELHAIGTAAVRQALDAFQAVGPGRAAERRHRVEHIETIDPADLGRFAELGVVASMQPFHGFPEAGQMAVWEGALDPELAASGWRIGSLLRSGAPIAFGSDWPVVPYDPFLELHAAVTRTTTDGQPAGGWLPGEAIGVADAMAAATWGSSYAEHAETERGALQVGRLADLIVLDRDLLSEGPSAILGTRVTATVVGGRIVP